MGEIVVASMIKGIIGEIKECSRSMQDDDGCKVVVPLQATRASSFLLCTTDLPAIGSGTIRGGSHR